VGPQRSVARAARGVPALLMDRHGVARKSFDVSAASRNNDLVCMAQSCGGGTSRDTGRTINRL
jgi:hypothetical protein